MPLPVQAKLLRALESGEYRPLGSERTLRSSFRLLAATNADICSLEAQGKLRTDLVYRLGAVRIVAPPLRSRLEDIPLLAEEFLEQYRERARHGPGEISTAALDVLARHTWPGNVRELRHVIEAGATIAAHATTISRSDLQQVFTPSLPEPQGADELPPLREIFRRAEKRAIDDALSRADGNREKAAKLLGLSPASLFRKLAKHRDPSR